MDKLKVTSHIKDDDLKIKMYKLVDIWRIFEKLRGGRAQIAQHKIYRH